METLVHTCHPNREELAQQAESLAKRFRALAQKAKSPSVRDRAYVMTQMALGRAAALRGTDPVQLPGPDGLTPFITSYADGRLEWIIDD